MAVSPGYSSCPPATTSHTAAGAGEGKVGCEMGCIGGGAGQAGADMSCARGGDFRPASQARAGCVHLAAVADSSSCQCHSLMMPREYTSAALVSLPWVSSSGAAKLAVP